MKTNILIFFKDWFDISSETEKIDLHTKEDYNGKFTIKEKGKTINEKGL